MATGETGGIIRHLRKAVLAPDGAGMTDGQLLERFVTERDEAAFAALVRRQGPMVWGVCRRVLRNHHDAEDAFQATFLVLVRRATAVVPREMVPSWLYGVAYRTALKARAVAGKRKARERQVVAMPEPAMKEQDLWRDLGPLLDQELNHLPHKYQVAIVLCDLEGKTLKEAARQLGLPEGTLSGRLTRGRAMLAKRLARHGFAVSSGVLATALAQNGAVAAPPPLLMNSTVKAATLLAAGQAASTSVISAQVAALTEGVVQAMFKTQVKIALAILLAVVFISGSLFTSRMVRATVDKTDPAKKGRKEGPAAEPKALLERALAHAADAEGGDLKVWIFGEIATAQARAGLQGAAEETLRKAEQVARDEKQKGGEGNRGDQLLGQVAEYRVKVVENLAKAGVKSGDARGALKTANALPANVRQRALTAIAVAQVETGDLKGARATAAQIPDAREALKAIATGEANAGNFKAAFKTVGTLPSDGAKAKALASIAACQARAGDRPGATKTLERALLLANGEADGTAKNSALVTIAGAQARAGLVAQARKTIDGLGDWQDLAWREVVAALVERGDTREALLAAERIKFGDGKTEARADVLGAVAKKDLAGARRIAGAIKDDVYADMGRFYAHLAIARAQAATDRGGAARSFQDALREAERLQDKEGFKDVRLFALANLAKAQAEVGEEKAALAWIEKYPAADVKARALWRVAEALIERQQTKKRPEK